MHTALWVSGIGCIGFALSALMAAFSDTKNPDQALATSIGALIFGAISGLCGIVWLALVVIKAANS